MLDGVTVRCGYCGAIYTHCSWCDKEQRPGGALGARNRLAEVNPQVADTVFASG